MCIDRPSPHHLYYNILVRIEDPLRIKHFLDLLHHINTRLRLGVADVRCLHHTCRKTSQQCVEKAVEGDLPSPCSAEMDPRSSATISYT